MDKLEDWKRQLEQAREYGLFFDRETVCEMLERIDSLQNHLMDIGNSMYKAIEEINKTKFSKAISILEETIEIEEGGFKLESWKAFSFSLFDVTEIQYLRGLVMTDQFVNHYQKQGEKALIAQNKTMWEFTQEILKKLDKMESD